MGSTTRARRNAIGSIGAGIVILMFACWLLIEQTYFYWNSTPLQATIAEVLYEKVPGGRGSAMAYIPVVELDDFGQRIRIKIDTNDDAPIYSVGSPMSLRCRKEGLVVCQEDEFIKPWIPGILAFILAVVFIGVGV